MVTHHRLTAQPGERDRARTLPADLLFRFRPANGTARYGRPFCSARSGAAGERRGRGQDCVSGVPLADLEADYQLFSGCREDVLRKVNGAWKVARRKIVFDANALLDKNLSVFL